MIEISKERAEEIHAAWEQASSTERLRLTRMEWVSANGTTYYETQPSALEIVAAERIAELEDDMRRIADHDLSNQRFHAGADLSIVIQSMRNIALNALKTDPHR